MNLRKYFWLTNTIAILAIAGVLIFGSVNLYVIVYITLFLILLARTFLTRGAKRVKFWLSLIFGFILICQIMLAQELLLLPDINGGEVVPLDPSHFAYWPNRIVCALVIVAPLIISRYVMVGKYAQFYLPPIKEAGSIGLAELKNVMAKALLLAEKAEHTKKSLSPANFHTIFTDLPRHDSFNYVNYGTLTKKYFASAQQTLADRRLYIVVSRTGSAASDIISVFTNKNYNHASLSFDRELETTVSYNGGNNVYPPGMNPEMLADFNKKGDASILVYSLPCSTEQKALVLQTIHDINESGSAYNMLGLVTKHSYRPNIMFCSQFVYRMLELAGLAYFKKAGGRVEPTDFIELDYQRALTFEYEIKL
jgi:hypothetical protein